jgi:LAO/AO transport system kinase
MTPDARRKLSKRLSALLVMPALQAMAQNPLKSEKPGRRIGFSGPPGAGKSSLIAAWAQERLRKSRTVGVLAVDPSSPNSGGSLLGDRIRMDNVTDQAAFFVRSVPSRSAHDGLCPNAAALLDELEAAGFDDVVLETVGVGQAEYAARALVDTFIVVFDPQSGDAVQAMKAGILEVADILVVNKADLPAAKRMVSELDGVIALRAASQWRPPVIAISVLQTTSMEPLEHAIARHALISEHSHMERLRRRRQYRIRSALLAQIDEIIMSYEAERWDAPVEDISTLILGRLQLT